MSYESELILNSKLKTTKVGIPGASF